MIDEEIAVFRPSRGRWVSIGWEGLSAEFKYLHHNQRLGLFAM